MDYMDSYKINTETLAIVPINRKKSKIYENQNIIIVKKSANKIIEENCDGIDRRHPQSTDFDRRFAKHSVFSDEQSETERLQLDFS